MAGRNYKVGHNRQQTELLPPSIDDYVSEHNPVRAIDAYVETLCLLDLKIQSSDKGLTAGQPAFHPSLLIKLYLYGYMNREGFHSAEDTGKSDSDIITNRGRKIKPFVWRLYASTATGNFTDTTAGLSLLKNPRILLLVSARRLFASRSCT